MIIFGYLLGAFLHISVKILGFIGAHKDQTFRNYWSLYGSLVTKGMIFDTVIFALWKIGLIPYLMGAVGMSMPAGYSMPDNVEVWAGIAAGYAADSIGKSFMSAIERFYSKGLELTRSK